MLRQNQLKDGGTNQTLKLHPKEVMILTRCQAQK
jgi:hypothetical protein